MGAPEDLKHIRKSGVLDTISLIGRNPKTPILLVIVFMLWTFCGWVYSDDFEGEGYVEFFVKKKPTPFHARFLDPFDSDPPGEEWRYRQRMDENGDWLPGTKEFDRARLYCWHRISIADIAEKENLERCKIASRLGKGRLTKQVD